MACLPPPEALEQLLASLTRQLQMQHFVHPSHFLARPFQLLCASAEVVLGMAVSSAQALLPSHCQLLLQLLTQWTNIHSCLARLVLMHCCRTTSVGHAASDPPQDCQGLQAGSTVSGMLSTTAPSAVTAAALHHLTLLPGLGSIAMRQGLQQLLGAACLPCLETLFPPIASPLTTHHQPLPGAAGAAGAAVGAAGAEGAASKSGLSVDGEHMTPGMADVDDGAAVELLKAHFLAPPSLPQPTALLTASSVSTGPGHHDLLARPLPNLTSNTRPPPRPPPCPPSLAAIHPSTSNSSSSSSSSNWRSRSREGDLRALALTACLMSCRRVLRMVLASVATLPTDAAHPRKPAPGLEVREGLDEAADPGGARPLPWELNVGQRRGLERCLLQHALMPCWAWQGLATGPEQQEATSSSSRVLAMRLLHQLHPTPYPSGPLDEASTLLLPILSAMAWACHQQAAAGTAALPFGSCIALSFAPSYSSSPSPPEHASLNTHSSSAAQVVATAAVAALAGQLDMPGLAAANARQAETLQAGSLPVSSYPPVPLLPHTQLVALADWLVCLASTGLASQPITDLLVAAMAAAKAVHVHVHPLPPSLSDVTFALPSASSSMPSQPSTGAGSEQESSRDTAMPDPPSGPGCSSNTLKASTFLTHRSNLSLTHCDQLQRLLGAVRDRVQLLPDSSLAALLQYTWLNPDRPQAQARPDATQSSGAQLWRWLLAPAQPAGSTGDPRSSRPAYTNTVELDTIVAAAATELSAPEDAAAQAFAASSNRVAEGPKAMEEGRPRAQLLPVRVFDQLLLLLQASPPPLTPGGHPDPGDGAVDDAVEGAVLSPALVLECQLVLVDACVQHGCDGMLMLLRMMEQVTRLLLPPHPTVSCDHLPARGATAGGWPTRPEPPSQSHPFPTQEPHTPSPGHGPASRAATLALAWVQPLLAVVHLVLAAAVAQRPSQPRTAPAVAHSTSPDGTLTASASPCAGPSPGEHRAGGGPLTPRQPSLQQRVPSPAHQQAHGPSLDGLPGSVELAGGVTGGSDNWAPGLGSAGVGPLGMDSDESPGNDTTSPSYPDGSTEGPTQPEANSQVIEQAAEEGGREGADASTQQAAGEVVGMGSDQAAMDTGPPAAITLHISEGAARDLGSSLPAQLGDMQSEGHTGAAGEEGVHEMGDVEYEEWEASMIREMMQVERAAVAAMGDGDVGASMGALEAVFEAVLHGGDGEDEAGGIGRSSPDERGVQAASAEAGDQGPGSDSGAGGLVHDMLLDDLALDRASSCEEDSEAFGLVGDASYRHHPNHAGRHQPNSQHAHLTAPRKLSRGDSNSSSSESSGSSIDSSSSSGRSSGDGGGGGSASSSSSSSGSSGSSGSAGTEWHDARSLGARGAHQACSKGTSEGASRSKDAVVGPAAGRKKPRQRLHKLGMQAELDYRAALGMAGKRGRHPVDSCSLDTSDGCDSGAECGALQRARPRKQQHREGGEPEPPKLQCSFAQNGESFIEQHWYFCYTCGLVDSKGCCAACLRCCHAGHDTVYSGRSRFFCDCGANANAPATHPCRCLTPVPLPHDPRALPSSRSSRGRTALPLPRTPEDAGTEAAAATSAASCEDCQGGNAGGGMSRLQALALAPWAPPLMWDPLDRAWAWDPEQPGAGAVWASMHRARQRAFRQLAVVMVSKEGGGGQRTQGSAEDVLERPVTHARAGGVAEPTLQRCPAAALAAALQQAGCLDATDQEFDGLADAFDSTAQDACGASGALATPLPSSHATHTIQKHVKALTASLLELLQPPAPDTRASASSSFAAAAGHPPAEPLARVSQVEPHPELAQLGLLLHRVGHGLTAVAQHLLGVGHWDHRGWPAAAQPTYTSSHAAHLPPRLPWTSPPLAAMGNPMSPDSTSSCATAPALLLPAEPALKPLELLKLQRIVRVGNLDGRVTRGNTAATTTSSSTSSSATSSTTPGGTAAATAGAAAAGAAMVLGSAARAPPELQEALMHGTVSRNQVAVCSATKLLAVARGSQVGILDLGLHVHEMTSPLLQPSSNRTSASHPNLPPAPSSGSASAPAPAAPVASGPADASLPPPCTPACVCTPSVCHPWCRSCPCPSFCWKCWHQQQCWQQQQ
ncbi:hypothetical protein V8C86DRAFT_668649 [Haematococcus lacustris]